ISGRRIVVVAQCWIPQTNPTLAVIDLDIEAAENVEADNSVDLHRPATAPAFGPPVFIHLHQTFIHDHRRDISYRQLAELELRDQRWSRAHSPGCRHHTQG